MRIVFFGTPQFVVPVLEMLAKNHEIVGVITTPDEKIGRKQVLTPSPVAKYAQTYNIPVLKPHKLSEENFKFQILNFKFDLAVVAAYGKIIPQSILDIPKYGSLNIHPSLLPKYRGASPLQTAILNGDKSSAITIMQMDAEMDHGAIVAQEEFEILENDTFESLSKKVFEQSAKLLIKIIPNYIENKIPLIEQDHSKATYTTHLSKEAGYFDLPAGRQVLSDEFLKKLDRMIRAYYPWPNVWTRWQGKIVKFYPNNILQMEGKNPVSVKDFLNGYPNFPLRNF